MTSPRRLSGSITNQEETVKGSLSKKAVAFAHLDEARLGWFHLRAVVVAGIGFFTDAYDIFVIGQSLPMIYQVYYAKAYIAQMYPNGTSTVERTPQNTKLDFNKFYPNGVHVDAWLKASTNWGNLVGQLLFGILGDRWGRKKIYGVELIIICVCTIGSVLSASLTNGASILVVLSLWRFVLGIGIGGDYPVSAVITSEFANIRYRGMMIAAVFAMQGVGILMGGLVYIIVLAAFKPLIEQDYTYLDYVWRITIGVGVIPGLIAIYYRLTVPESPRFTADVMGATDVAVNDIEKILQINHINNVTTDWDAHEAVPKPEPIPKNKMRDFREFFGEWKNLKVLIGTAYCWFALDVAWYGLALNQSTVLTLIDFNGPAKVCQNHTENGITTSDCVTPPVDIWNSFFQVAVGNVIIAMAGTVPGYWFAVALIEKLGRKPIQIMGFAVISICLIILAAAWNTLIHRQVPFVVIFTIAQFFFQFGPNTTTFVIPGEVFPTRFRSTGHGISAACGKLGAIIGIQAVGPFFNNIPVLVLSLFAFIMLTGLLATFLLPETTGKSLEELSKEDTIVTAPIMLVNDDAEWITV